MNVRQKARISALATDLVRLSEKFSALGVEPDLAAFIVLVRDLSTEVEEVDGEVDKMTSPDPNVEQAVLNYIVNGVSPGLDWFVPRVGTFASAVLKHLPETVVR